jgi:Ca2+-binding RTX toxin-like protein
MSKIKLAGATTAARTVDVTALLNKNGAPLEGNALVSALNSIYLFDAKVKGNISATLKSGSNSYSYTANEVVAQNGAAPFVPVTVKTQLSGVTPIFKYVAADTVVNLGIRSNIQAAFSVIGGTGNDTISGGIAADTLNGGAGNDFVSYESAFSAGVNVTLNGSTATTVSGSAGSDVISNFEGILGSAFNDTLTGSASADTIYGNAGTDSIVGGAGDDLLSGGLGADTLTGGAGTDVFQVGALDSFPTFAGFGDAGTVAGFDVVTDFALAGGDKLDLPGTASVAAAGTFTTDSTLTTGGLVVSSFTISGGNVAFTDSAATAVSITTVNKLAAAVEALVNNDIGNAGDSVYFNVTYAAAVNGSVTHTYVYTQTGASAGGVLVDLVGVTGTSLITSGTTAGGILIQ